MLLIELQRRSDTDTIHHPPTTNDKTTGQTNKTHLSTRPLAHSSSAHLSLINLVLATTTRYPLCVCGWVLRTLLPLNCTRLRHFGDSKLLHLSTFACRLTLRYCQPDTGQEQKEGLYRVGSGQSALAVAVAVEQKQRSGSGLVVTYTQNGTKCDRN